MKFRSRSIFIFAGLLVSIQCRAQSPPDAETFGFLHFQFNVDTAYVQLGMNKPAIHKVADGDTLKVKNGFYHIYFSYPTNDDTYTTQNVRTDSLYTLNHNFDLTQTEINLKSINASIRYLVGGDIFIMTDEDTQILIENDTSGTESGAFDLEKERETTFTLLNDEFLPVNFQAVKKEAVIFKKYHFYPSNPTVLSYLPGLSQLKNKEYLKSVLIFGSIIASTSLFVRYQNEYHSHIPEYKRLKTIYLNADSEQEALAAGDNLAVVVDRLDKTNFKRNLAIWGIAGTLAFDLFDKINTRKKLGYRKHKSIEMYLAPQFEKYVSVGAKIKF